MRFALALLLAAPVAAQTPDELAEARESLLSITECELQALDWNAGNRRELEREFGSYAEKIVKACGVSNRASRQLLDDFLTKYPGALEPARPSR